MILIPILWNSFGATNLNSFLTTLFIVNIGILGINQFATTAFVGYCLGTASSSIFFYQMRQLRYIGVIYRYIVYGVFVFSIGFFFSNFIYYVGFVRYPDGKGMINELKHILGQLTSSEESSSSALSKKVKYFMFRPY